MEIGKVMGYMLSQSARSYKKAIDQALTTYNLTTVQCGVIRILRNVGELEQVEIAKLYSSDRATIGSVIQKLIDKGYVTKTLSKSDKRAYLVALTPKALEVSEQIEAISERTERKALQGLSQTEIDEFYRVLGQINSNLNQ